MAPSAPYRHFPDKDALLAAVAAECAKRLGDAMDAAAAEAGPDILDQFRALITRELAKGHVLLIGAETSKNGVQHSVAYIIEKGSGVIYKLHGGLTQLAKLEAAPLAKATIQGTVGRMNTMQVFNLAKSPEVVWRWWAKMAASEAFTSFVRAGLPKGCAGTVVLILEKLAAHGAIAGVPKLVGAARWLPMYLDRALGGYVLNATNVYLGTALSQALPLVTGISLLRFTLSMGLGGPGQPQGGYEFSNILPLDQYVPAAWLYSSETVQSFVGIPVATVLADAENMASAAGDFPAGGLVNYIPPPWVEVKNEPPAGPPKPGDDPIMGTWAINLGGQIKTMTFTRATGRWATAPNVYQSANYVVQGAEGGRYVHFPRSTPQGVIAFKLEGENLVEYYQNKPFRTWYR